MDYYIDNTTDYLLVVSLVNPFVVIASRAKVIISVKGKFDRTIFIRPHVQTVKYFLEVVGLVHPKGAVLPNTSDLNTKDLLYLPQVLDLENLREFFLKPVNIV